MSRARDLADSADLSFDGTTLVVDETNNRVGIGTASPSSALHVEGGTGSTIRNIASSGSSWFLGSNTSSYILHNISNTPMVFTTNGTAQMRLQSSGDLQFNSGFGSVATAYGCRAWVNFQGGNGTVNGSGNVSSVTDDGTGRYSVNFTTSMSDANYSVAGMGQRNGTVDGGIVQIATSGTTISGQSTAGVAIHTKNLTDSDRDFTTVMVQVVR